MLGCMLHSLSPPTQYRSRLGHQKTHPKISDSLLATVQCPRLYGYDSGKSIFIWIFDIIEHVHDRVLEPPCFFSN